MKGTLSGKKQLVLERNVTYEANKTPGDEKWNDKILISSEDYDTFTGLVFDALGTIPANGEEQIELELQNMLIRINKIEAHQIESAIVRLKEAETESHPGD